jgi:hypothetical protein
VHKTKGISAVTYMGTTSNTQKKTIKTAMAIDLFCREFSSQKAKEIKKINPIIPAIVFLC